MTPGRADTTRTQPGPILRGLKEVSDRYDAFLVDSYGVLHDGRTLFPDTRETLRALRTSGKSVLVLTNTPRRADVVAREIAQVGVDPDLYDRIVSAGELTFRRLSEPTALGLPEGAKFHYVGPERSRPLLDGLPIGPAAALEDADFLVILGLYAGREDLRDYQGLLREALARDLPAVCGNPDRTAIRAAVAGPAAGAIATAYEAMGGKVLNFGKPFPDIYDMALAALPGIAPERVLAVGDALYTDVAGALGAGLDTAFVASGIHETELGDIDPPQPAALASLFTREGISPTFTIPRFRMG